MRLGRPVFVRHGTGSEGRTTESASTSIATSGSATSVDAEVEGGVEIEVSEAREEPAMILVVDERAAWGLNSASSQHILQTTYSQPMLSVRRASRTA